MKHLLLIFLALTVLHTSYAQDVKTIYPLLSSEQQLISMIQVIAPKIKPLWMQSSPKMLFGIFAIDKTLYICAYPTDPNNYAAKEFLEQWKITDLKDKDLALGDVNWKNVNNLMLTSAFVNRDGTWIGSPYYFGKPIPLEHIKQNTIRVHLMNLKLAFDYALDEESILAKYKIDVSTKLLPIE